LGFVVFVVWGANGEELGWGRARRNNRARRVASRIVRDRRRQEKTKKDRAGETASREAVKGVKQKFR